MENTKHTMMGIRNLSLFISLLFFMSCSSHKNIQNSVNSIIENNEYTFIYIGSHWCQGSINSFVNHYSSIIDYCQGKIATVVIFFDRNGAVASNEEVNKCSPSLFATLSSRGSFLDKMSMNKICDDLLNDYKKEFKSPICIICHKDGSIIKQNLISESDIDNLKFNK